MNLGSLIPIILSFTGFSIFSGYLLWGWCCLAFICMVFIMLSFDNQGSLGDVCFFTYPLQELGTWQTNASSHWGLLVSNFKQTVQAILGFSQVPQVGVDAFCSINYIVKQVEYSKYSLSLYIYVICKTSCREAFSLRAELALILYLIWSSSFGVTCPEHGHIIDQHFGAEGHLVRLASVYIKVFLNLGRFGITRSLTLILCFQVGLKGLCICSSICQIGPPCNLVSGGPGKRGGPTHNFWGRL